MISHLRGKLYSKSLSSLVVDVGGIGYLVLCPFPLLDKLPVMGQEIFLYTSLVIREAAHTLYGFFSHEERDLFETLMDVSGIGPKTALSLLSHLSCAELCQAIFQKDLAALSQVPGIGKKTAERMVLELQDKLKKSFAFHTPEQFTIGSVIKNSSVSQDASSALMNLGYTQPLAQKAIEKALSSLGHDAELSSIIAFALRSGR